MIKAIAFDYGGVIELSQTNITEDIRIFLSIPKEEWSSVYFSLNHLCNTGSSTWEEVILMTSEKVGASEAQKSDIKKMIEDAITRKNINKELLQKIVSLKDSYKIALISNYSAQLRGLLIKQNIENLFDEIIISGEVGIQKPDPAIFNLLCSRLAIVPSELVFIDDTEKSLENAKLVGYIPILFKNNEQLFSDLKTNLI